MMQTQQLKHLQQCQMHSQLMQHQILFQRHQQQQQQQQHQQHPQLQQQLQQQKQQQSAPLQAHQIPQLHQLNEFNDLKVRKGMVVKQGIFPQHYSAGQRSAYHHQQLKTGASFPITSHQLLQAASPQISLHSSPQIDQQSLLTSLSKAEMPLQSRNSLFIIPSPSPPMVPSPMPGDAEKQPSGVSVLSNVANIGHQQSQSLAIGTPGISVSPLLAEFTSPDGNQVTASAIVSGKSNVTEQPMERVMKVDGSFHPSRLLVKSLSSKALSASVGDIWQVVMNDRIAGSAPVNGSRAAVGVDLVGMTKCHLQARNFISQHGSATAKKMRCDTSAMHLTATSRIKKPRVEANHALLKEIRKINLQLIDTVVDVSSEDIDPTAAAAEVAAAEVGEGTIVKCSFSAVTQSKFEVAVYFSTNVPISAFKVACPCKLSKIVPLYF
ncbi:hypothetical protein NE237_020913 [Protea cynaroides]|uniref:Uncharacterized protein n=1 Tax=Protea cynaroides TaxID=273540 RepID=A0A9Q0H7I2_9MAGN|nr:hypothetical protein NE237_020913 [Protea cynaroides]